MALPSYDWGPWRVVMSNALGKPFFFNTATEIGQFAIPKELKMIPFEDEDEEEDLEEGSEEESEVNNGKLEKTESDGSK